LLDLEAKVNAKAAKAHLQIVITTLLEAAIFTLIRSAHQEIQILALDPQYEARISWGFLSKPTPDAKLFSSMPVLVTHVFNHCPDECDGFKTCAPNVNMQMMGTGLDDGMNQAWSLDIAGED